MDTDEHGRPEPPGRGDEVSTLIGFLEWQRATFAWKTADVDDAGLRHVHTPSTMTLGGLATHLAWVESFWFSERLHGRPPAPPWVGVDWAADPDADWHLADRLTPSDIREVWGSAVGRSRADVDEALAAGGLDRCTVTSDARGPLSLRWLLLHMVEEYARHNGHADLLRESVDGSTGE